MAGSAGTTSSTIKPVPRGRATLWTDDELQGMVALTRARQSSVRRAFDRAVNPQLRPLLDAETVMPDEAAPDV